VAIEQPFPQVSARTDFASENEPTARVGARECLILLPKAAGSLQIYVKQQTPTPKARRPVAKYNRAPRRHGVQSFPPLALVNAGWEAKPRVNTLGENSPPYSEMLNNLHD